MVVTRNEHGNPSITVELIAGCDVEEAASEAIGRDLAEDEIGAILEHVMGSAREFQQLEEEIWDRALGIAVEAARKLDEERRNRTGRPRSEAELAVWYSEIEDRVTAASTDWPAAWGGQYRIDDGGSYTSEEAMGGILDEHGLLLYYAMSANSEDPSRWKLSEISAHVDDKEWLMQLADEYIEAGGTVYYTEACPGDYGAEELAELLDERPDLADGGTPMVAEAARSLDALEAECAEAVSAPGAPAAEAKEER